MICLDTNSIIAAINRRTPHVRERLEKALVDGVTVGLPVIALYEIWYGIGKSARREQNALALTTFLTLNITPWPFETEDAEEAADIRVTLERNGTPIGPYDVLIAAQARRRAALLVTANTREFVRIPGLETTNWAGD
jgi:tRNA(fMet)-specific endonuclease VapC